MNRVVIHCDACCDGVTCVACAVTSTGVTVPATNMSRNMQYNSFDTNLLDCSRERVWQHQRGTNTARSRRPLSGKNHEYFGHSDAHLPALTSATGICPLSRIAGIKLRGGLPLVRRHGAPPAPEWPCSHEQSRAPVTTADLGDASLGRASGGPTRSPARPPRRARELTATRHARAGARTRRGRGRRRGAAGESRPRRARRRRRRKPEERAARQARDPTRHAIASAKRRRTSKGAGPRAGCTRTARSITCAGRKSTGARCRADAHHLRRRCATRARAAPARAGAGLALRRQARSRRAQVERAAGALSGDRAAATTPGRAATALTFVRSSTSPRARAQSRRGATSGSPAADEAGQQPQCASANTASVGRRAAVPRTIARALGRPPRATLRRGPHGPRRAQCEEARGMPSRASSPALHHRDHRTRVQAARPAPRRRRGRPRSAAGATQ